MCKTLQSRFNSTRMVNFQMFKLGLEKAEKLEIKLPTSVGSSKKQDNTRKTSTSALLTHKVKQHCKKAEVKPELHFCSQTDNDISLQPGIISGSPWKFEVLCKE